MLNNGRGSRKSSRSWSVELVELELDGTPDPRPRSGLGSFRDRSVWRWAGQRRLGATNKIGAPRFADKALEFLNIGLDQLHNRS